jgi:hypothetical protein
MVPDKREGILMKAVLLFGEGDTFWAVPSTILEDAVFSAKTLMLAKKIKSYELPYELQNMLSKEPEKEEV